MKLSKFIYSDMNIARSINLERDYEKTDVIIDYRITAKTQEVLGRFADALHGEKISAWSLTGPYGMGKSAFVNYLMALTGSLGSGVTRVALKKLDRVNAGLHERLLSGMDRTVGDKGFFRIPITAAYEPVNLTLVRGLRDALTCVDVPGVVRAQETIKAFKGQGVIESGDIINLLQNISKSIQRPIIIVIDEFGKNLEYMAHHYDKGDIFIIQQLAELGYVYLWVCLHQAFDEYVYGLSEVRSQEWSKIQGRFEDVYFMESTTQMLHLIRNALGQNLQKEQVERIYGWATDAKNFIDTYMADYRKLGIDAIIDIYPLHPLTAVALIELCRKFAQNDRTLLSFLCSGHVNALPAYLDKTEMNAVGSLPTVGLDYLYDYFFHISTTAYVNRAESQQWIEVHDKISGDNHNLLPQQKVILKNIGIMNLLSGALGVKAGPETISYIMGYSQNMVPEKTTTIINELVNRGVILYREYAGEYRLWEGSDFDISGAIRRKRAELAITSMVDTLLQRYLPLTPIIAARHSYNTGTVRRFERRWLHGEHLTEDLAPTKGYDGLFLYCFGTDAKPSHVPKNCSDDRPLFIAYAPCLAKIQELALQVAAARLVLTESPELVHDSVARKEVRFRVKVAEQQFRELVSQMYLPGSVDVIWYYKGGPIEVQNTKEQSSILSSLCDDVYSSSPIIRNEMVGYEKLSSAVVRARRELVEAMATRVGEENLGFKGFGPEVALYRSLLLADGLHVRDDSTGCWRLTLGGKDSHLGRLWEMVDKLIAGAGDAGIAIADILDLLGRPPFGMRRGPAPIYICLYLLVNSEKVAVFREGAYQPYLTAADMALILKRPDLFSLKYFTSTNVERRIFGIYQSIVNVARLKGDQKPRNEAMLGVVGPLVQYINHLPVYSRRTRRISREAQLVRSAILNSVDPVDLLFKELPAAVGIHPVQKGGVSLPEERDVLQKRLSSALLEIGQAYDGLRAEVELALLTSFKHSNLRELHRTLRERITPLIDICADTGLKPFLKALTQEYRDLSRWVKGIAGIIVKRPMDSWDDTDFTLFTAKLQDYVDRVTQLETLASVNGHLIDGDTRLLSIMTPQGVVKRKMLSTTNIRDRKVQEILEKAMSLSDERINAVVAGLVDKMFKRDAGEE